MSPLSLPVQVCSAALDHCATVFSPTRLANRVHTLKTRDLNVPPALSDADDWH